MVFETPDHSSDEPSAPAVARHQLLDTPGGSSAELQPAGSLDIESADDFRQMFARLLDSGVVRFFVDLGEVHYLDSTGLGSLMQLHREATGRGGTVRFYNLAPAVRDVFELTHLDRVVDVVSSRQEAFSKT